MRAQQNRFLHLILIGLSLSLAACGKQGRSSEVDIEVMPQKPIVINTDTTYYWDTVPLKVKAPWFKCFVNIKNNSDLALLVAALHVEVTGLDDSGQITTKTTDFDPSLFSYNRVTTICPYNDFGLFSPHGTA